MQLDHLVGKKLIDASVCQDYLQLNIDHVYGINLYNNYSLKGGNLDSFRDKTILGIQKSKDELLFLFSDSLEICMSLKDEDFNGPEALEYRGPSGEIIVWN